MVGGRMGIQMGIAFSKVMSKSGLHSDARWSMRKSGFRCESNCVSHDLTANGSVQFPPSSDMVGII